MEVIFHCEEALSKFEKANWMISDVAFSYDERVALVHLVFHLAEAQDFTNVNKWFCDFPRLLLLVSFVQHNSGASGITQLVNDALSFSDDFVVSALKVVSLGTAALTFNPLELAGQVMGRLDNSHPLVSGANEWATKMKQQGFTIALPLKPSGLSSADDVISFKFDGHRESVYLFK
jgi:hypothetical protein